MNQHDDENTEDLEKGLNSIAVAMNVFIHALKDSEEVVYNFVPLAARVHNKRIAKIEENEKIAIELMESKDEQDQAIGSKKLLDVVRLSERVVNANVPETIQKALFLNLFSSFDAFIGDLIACIFSRKPEFYNGLGKQVSVSEILLFNNFDELKQKILTDEIETLRRKSYTEQFADMEKMFSVKLKAFTHWSAFIELSQRRNILMHCDGVVSEQYIKVCQKEGYKLSNDLNPGDVLSLDQDYLENAFNLLAEVTIKLGQTLWRKTQPEDLEEADDHLSEVIYDYLHEKDWNKAICFGEFSMNLPSISSDLMSKVNVTNLSIAHKMSGNEEEANRILSAVDWSASINDFKLAHAVLTDDFLEAKELMLKIGRDGGELIKESAYHNFPLFSKFRESEEFMKGYEAVFGYSFISEIIRKSDDKEESESNQEPK
jgi:hypothetical protein